MTKRFFIVVFLFLFCEAYTQFPGIEIQKNGTEITIKGNLINHNISQNKLIVVIESDRNKKITRNDEPSPLDPDYKQKEKNDRFPHQEMWFPVIDTEIDSNTFIKAYFSNVSVGDNYCFNGNFYPKREKLTKIVSIHKNLLHWENSFYVHSEDKVFPILEKFIVCKKVSDINKSDFLYSFQLLTEEWKGTIQLEYEGKIITSKKFEHNNKGSIRKANASLKKEDVIESLKQTITFLLKSRDTNTNSPTYKGLYLFYDVDAKTYRRPDWIWSWGTTIKLLLDAAEVPELAEAFGRENLIRTAKEIGETALTFQIKDKDHPAYGLFRTYISPRFSHTKCGHGVYAGPADSYFLIGYGLLPLYEKTGENKYLIASKISLEQTSRLLEQDPVIEQDFLLNTGKWKNWTMDESGFGMIAFKEYHRLTQDDSIKKLGKEYFTSLQNVFQRDDGLWERVWHRNNPQRDDDNWKSTKPRGVPQLITLKYQTRGLAWAMIGLLAAHELYPTDNYLNTAQKMGAHLKNAQHKEGYWSYKYNLSKDKEGISEKGTAIWSLLFYQLYAETGNREDLTSARKSLLWCMQNQENSEDTHAKGGIIGISPSSGIIYRWYYPMICTYTMSFYGLAALEELKIQQTKL